MINLRQIEAFREVMRNGTTTLAAEKLHVSQPAVSRLINDLQHHMGFELFVRQGRQLVPTPEAKALFEEIERSYIGLDHIINAARDIREFRRGELFVCAMPMFALSLLPDVTHTFSNQYSDIALSLQTHSSQRVLEWVASQQCDLGFISMDIDNAAVRRISVGTGRMQIVIPSKHPLAKHKSITPKDLDGVPMVGLGQQLELQPEIREAFKNFNIEPNERIQTQLSSVACELVLAGDVVSIVDPFSALLYSKRGLVVRDFEPAIMQEWRALLPKYRPASRLALEFIESCRMRIKQLLG